MAVILPNLNKISPATLFANKGGKSHAITTPWLDFFFVGGLSFLLLPVVFFQDIGLPYRLAMIVFSLGFVINYPHFMHSYQLLYSGFLNKIRSPDTPMSRKIRLVFSGVIVPLALFEFLAIGIVQESHQLLGYGANLMFVLVGWHYAKQGYGIFISLSVRQKVFYSDLEKRILLLNVYMCCIYFWCFSNQRIQEVILYGIKYSSFEVPPVIVNITMVLCILSSCASVFVIARKYLADKQICINGLVAYSCSIYVWLKLVYLHPILVYCIPALHSLQYLLFVWKMQYEKLGEKHKESQRAQFDQQLAHSMRNFFGVAVTLGALFFYLIPVTFDQYFPYHKGIMGTEMFLYAFMIFINIHHYFIDFAIWRRDNPDMKYLFR